MSAHPVLRAAAVVALLLVAGCSAPVAGPGTPPGPPPDVAYRGNSLPFEAGPVFHRMQGVLGTNVTPPEHVRVVDDPAALGSGASGTSLPRFWRIAGVTTGPGLSAAEVDRLENGVTTGIGAIAVYPGESADADDRWVLAHEFVHYIQFQRDVGLRLQGAVAATTTDGAYVVRSVIEGGAVYATNAYLRTYAPDRPPNSALYARLNQTLAVGSYAWHMNLAYVEGHEYVAARIDSPADLETVYADPPTTSEQVIHGLAPGAEPPAPLSVRAETPGPWRVTATDRLGEAFVRSALAGAVPVAEASRAAAGWGNDTLYTFRRPDAANASYAWVLRWDSAADADEFAAAYREALAARGQRVGDAWRVANATVSLRRPNATTTVLVAGDPSFVAGLTVRADAGVVLETG